MREKQQKEKLKLTSARRAQWISVFSFLFSVFCPELGAGAGLRVWQLPGGEQRAVGERSSNM